MTKKLLSLSLLMAMSFTTPSYAGKIKSASSYYAQVKESAHQVEEKLNLLQDYLENIKTTGSFLKTDFWGTSPAWYLNTSSGLTNVYPLSLALERQVKREYKDSVLIRNIKDIALKPLKTDNWTVGINLDYGFIFDRNWNKYSNPELIQKRLLQDGVPIAKVKEALNDYYGAYILVEKLILNDLVPQTDKLYKRALFGLMQANHPKLKALFGKDYTNIKAHPEILKKNLDKLTFDGLHESLGLKNLKDLQEKYRKMELNGDAFDFYITVARYSFQVGNSSDESLKQSHILDFSQLLNEKTESGQAKVEPYNQSSSFAFPSDTGKIKIYSDTDTNLKYKGLVMFDESTGVGVWQTALWRSKQDLEQIAEQIKEQKQVFEKTASTYLDMALRETVLKYKPQEATQSDDF